MNATQTKKGASKMKNLSADFANVQTLADVENLLTGTANTERDARIAKLELERQDLVLMSREACETDRADSIQYKLRSARIDAIDAEIFQILGQ